MCECIHTFVTRKETGHSRRTFACPFGIGMLRSISPPTASPPRRRSPQAAASAPRNEQRSTLVSPSLASAGSLATDALDRSLGFLRIPLASSANLHLLGADPDHFTEYTLLLNNSRAPLLHPDNLLAWMSCRRMSSRFLHLP